MCTLLRGYTPRRYRKNGNNERRKIKIKLLLFYRVIYVVSVSVGCVAARCGDTRV